MKISELEPIEEAEKIKTEYMNRERLKIFEKVTNKAFYTPTFDYIEVPCKEQYQNIEEFYSTLFHEMIHRIETEKSFRNSSAYIQNWLQALKNNNKFIVSASSKAEKAVKYILNEQ